MANILRAMEMMTNPSNEALAREFWATSKLPENFPRDIERAIALALPLAIIKLPLLKADKVQSWLEQKGLAFSLPYDRRELMGCLVAHRGRGIIFINGTDCIEEQRYTLAHEAAHFLCDYLIPRQQVVNALGDQIIDVLDGVRAASLAERADAILSHVRLGAHIHLMPKQDGNEEATYIEDAEHEADDLALELVAPRAKLVPLLEEIFARGATESSEICRELGAYFGLPAYILQQIIHSGGLQAQPVSFFADILSSIRGQQSGR
ncbi:MAG: ImmA/IrrE family metallo-endopeptidase [Actinobacteria bacterium]|nr:ImmA/IrrE family metallo-endopeptidase [Actinomycetota bacterium]